MQLDCGLFDRFYAFDDLAIFDELIRVLDRLFDRVEIESRLVGLPGSSLGKQKEPEKANSNCVKQHGFHRKGNG